MDDKTREVGPSAADQGKTSRPSSSEPDSKSSPEPNTSSRRTKPVSQKKIEANRRNARLSTGPKTARGKRTVALNAVRHGILAREVVITAGDGKENAEEFEHFVNQLYESCKPVGALEEMEVQKIATCWWRKRRALRAENGYLRKGLDSCYVDSAIRHSNQVSMNRLCIDALRAGELFQFSQADEEAPLRDRVATAQQLCTELKRDVSALRYLIDLLEFTKRQVQSEGCIHEDLYKALQVAFATTEYDFVLNCYELRTRESGERNLSHQASTSNDQAAVYRVLVPLLIDSQIRKLQMLREKADENVMNRPDAEARSLSLPDEGATNRIIRYEAHLDRQLCRAEARLERLQRHRKGELVPPPLNVNLRRSD